MKKRFLSGILAIVMMLSCIMIVPSAAEETSGGSAKLTDIGSLRAGLAAAPTPKDNVKIGTVPVASADIEMSEDYMPEEIWAEEGLCIAGENFMLMPNYRGKFEYWGGIENANNLFVKDAYILVNADYTKLFVMVRVHDEYVEFGYSEEWCRECVEVFIDPTNLTKTTDHSGVYQYRLGRDGSITLNNEYCTEDEFDGYVYNAFFDEIDDDGNDVDYTAFQMVIDISGFGVDPAYAAGSEIGISMLYVSCPLQGNFGAQHVLLMNCSGMDMRNRATWDTSVWDYITLGEETPAVLMGDMNGDGEVSSDDAVYLLYHTLLPELYPISQDADFNGDGEVNSDDAVYLLYHTLLPDVYPLA